MTKQQLVEVYIDKEKTKPVPVKVYFERRKNTRASIGQKFIILRIPNVLNEKQQHEAWEWFNKWLKEQFVDNKRLHFKFFGRNYKDGDELKVYGKSYTIYLKEENSDKNYGDIKGSKIYLRLSDSDSNFGRIKSIRHLISRCVANDNQLDIERRVKELNYMHFKKNVKSVNLKYNQSNWGSCSTKENINLSTRLLFAPSDVIDYVIIHELAHLIEMNHSKHFWKLVSDAMPTYKEKEKWLDKNGYWCQF